MSEEPVSTRKQILSNVWSSLREGAAHGAHPFHTPVLATNAGNRPDVRTVVLRHANEEQSRIFCHTDVRSPKVLMLERNPLIAWLFYDREAKVQLRLYGEGSLHCADAIAKARWDKSTPSSRSCYLADHAPGEVLSTAAKGPVVEHDGFDNFAVISCEVSSIDWLFLQASGHKRARFVRNEGHWGGTWIAP